MAAGVPPAVASTSSSSGAASGAAGSAMGALGPIINGLFGMFGQRRANQANVGLQNDQQKWNLQQWNREVGQEQSNWNQQNEYNQQLWGQQNQYNEGRWNIENKYNEEIWDKQNKYNSPQAQMARLREAGLSPHLMYGKGTMGQAGTQATGSMRTGMAAQNGLKSPDVKGYTRANAESVTRGMDIFGDHYRFKNIQAQTNNVEANTDVLKQEALLKAQQGLINTVNIKQKGLDFKTTSGISKYSIEAARIGVETATNNLRTSGVAANVAEANAPNRIAKLKKEVQILKVQFKGKKLDNQIKQLQYNYKSIPQKMWEKITGIKQTGPYGHIKF